jgi:hypothetical protein
MTAEARELYAYVTSVEPFVTQIEKVNMDCVSPMMVIRQITRNAMEQYNKDYCTAYAELFTSNDFKEVTERIYNEKRGTDMTKYEKCVETLTPDIFSQWNFFTVEEVKPEIRPCTTSIEGYGVIAIAKDFINDYTWYSEDYESVYDNTSGEREGRFDCHDNYEIKDTGYEIGAFVVWGSVICAEIYDEDGNNVAYIRIN